MTVIIKDRGRQTFIKELTKNSSISTLKDESDYDKILDEWELYKVFSTELILNKCICGQSIKNVCIIKNTITNKQCMVGSDCAEKLMYRDYTNHFKTKLTQKEFITDFTNSLEEHYKEVFSTYEIKFLKDIESKINYSLKQKYNTIYKLSDKQTEFYYKIWQKLIRYIKDNPVDLPIEKDIFDLYEQDNGKLLNVLESNRQDIFTEIFNPVLFSYLVYKEICTKEQYNRYYATCKYTFKKNIYKYRESTAKLNYLIEQEILILEESLK